MIDCVSSYSTVAARLIRTNYKCIQTNVHHHLPKRNKLSDEYASTFTDVHIVYAVGFPNARSPGPESPPCRCGQRNFKLGGEFVSGRTPFSFTALNAAVVQEYRYPYLVSTNTGSGGSNPFQTHHDWSATPRIYAMPHSSTGTSARGLCGTMYHEKGARTAAQR